MANQTIKDIHKSPAQAVIDSEAKDVINYYAEERAALSYAPVMTADRGSNFPTPLLISTAGEATWSQLPPLRQTTPVPLPQDLRPTAEDWQPSCEVTPSTEGYDLGGFIVPGGGGTTKPTAPKKVSITWPSSITAYLCRLPYSPLTSWPWRVWWGDSLPLYIEGGRGVTYHPQEGGTLVLAKNVTGDGVLWQRDAFPYFSELRIAGRDYAPAKGVELIRFISGNGNATYSDVYYQVYDEQAQDFSDWVSFPVAMDLTGVRHSIFVTIANVEGLPATTSFFVGVASNSLLAGRLTLSSAAYEAAWDCKITTKLVSSVPTGCDIYLLKKEDGNKPINVLSWWQVSISDVTSSASAMGIGLTLMHQNFPDLASYSFLTVASDSAVPPLNPYTHSYSPVTLFDGLPIDETTVPSEGHPLELPTANTMNSGWLTPSDLRARGYDVDTSVFSVPCVVPQDWDGSHSLPSDEFIAKMQAKSDEWGCIVSYPFYKYAPAVFAGVYDDGDLRVGARWNVAVFGSHAHVCCTVPRAWAGKTVRIGYREDGKAQKNAEHVLSNLESKLLGRGVFVNSETVAPIGMGHNNINWFDFQFPAKITTAFLIGRHRPGFMRLEQRRNFPVPFAPAFASLRPNWPGALRNNGLGGRLTDMTLPACAYDIVLHWWTEDGKSLALPFKAVAVERSAKVVAETKTDVLADDWMTAERTQYTTMRGETETRYRCALELDEEEAKTAATIAESPFFCYTTADDEVTRHWCELVDVKEEWSNGETDEITITIKDI